MGVRLNKNGKWQVEFGSSKLGTRYTTSVSPKIHGKYAKDIAEYIFNNELRETVYNWFKKMDGYYIIYAYQYTTDEYFEILIDEDDFNRVSQYHWGVYENTSSDTYYSRSRGAANANPEIGATDAKLHRFIMNVIDPKIKVDHINGNGLDNRKANLRVCPKKSVINERNRQNINKNNTSGYPGVQFQENRNRYICKWLDENSNMKQKCFNLKKYNNSKEKAFEAAKAYRIEMEKKYYYNHNNKEDED